MLDKVIGWRNIGDSNYSIEQNKFLEIFEEVVQESSPVAWVHTSGFEGKYNLISKAEKILPHYGLSELKIKKIRNPTNFFKILKKLDINFPETIVNRFDSQLPSGWLRKNFDTTGGLGIKKNNIMQSASQGTYLQKEITGKPLSVFFLVEHENIIVFGFCENLFLKTNNFPYLHQGIVGPVRVSNEIKKIVFSGIKKIVKEFNLVGLNGLDFIIMNEEVFVLELNPRPTAAMEIFEKVFNKSLLSMHCNVFITAKNEKSHKDITFLKNNNFFKRVFGIRIVYSDRNVRLNSDFVHQLKLLPFCRDIPNIENLKVGDPVCSIMIESDNIITVKTLLLNAYFSVLDLLEKTSKTFN